ncbi:hypothetical protein [Micromonospora thermarum]|uniref:Uncharacterized protein n=1 Tax=Micromonospora thermarum TaxID=2720024 RepID=A0ABX0Z4L6_9ACTN|nr:hypothetical protein [Micromonospora thermarum]NJP31116.1 hypothetical protein [Micromonospora thermarum]
MPSVAPARPLWGTVLRSLREMTRLAVVALALGAGFGGAPAATAAPPPAVVEAARPGIAIDVDTLVASGSADSPALWTSTIATRDAAPASWHAVASTPAGGAAVRPLIKPAVSRAAVSDARHEPAGEPGEGATTRRGPPTA